MRFDARAAKQLQAGQHIIVEGGLRQRPVDTADVQTWACRRRSHIDGHLRPMALGAWSACRVRALIDLDPAPDTAEGERLEVLGMLVEAYEDRHHPIGLPGPIEALKFVMEQRGLSVADMKPYIGAPNRVYEVLNRKRPLTLAMIRRLTGLGIPAEVLIGEPAPSDGEGLALSA